MTKKIPAQPDFWAQAHFKALTSQTHDSEQMLMTSIRARDFQRVINNIIRPLCRDLGAHLLDAQYMHMADKLADVARKGDPNELADFPKDDGKQLILDRLDGIEANLRRLNSKLRYVEIAADGENIFIDFRSREERRAA